MEKETILNSENTFVLKSLTSAPLFTPEEEKECFKKIKYGTKEESKKAKEEMILRNTRLVIMVARHYNGASSSLTLSDLVQSGIFGLIKAIDLFDISRDLKFSTYATFWIRQTISRAVVDTGASIRLPVFAHEAMNKTHVYVHDFYSKYGHYPKSEDVAKELNIPISYVDLYFQQGISVASLNTKVGGQRDEGEDSELIGFIADHDTDVEGEVIENEINRQIRDIVDTLPEREAKIIRLRYGLDNGEPMTLQQVGEQMGVTRERIRQIEVKALKKLKNSKSLRTLNEAL